MQRLRNCTLFLLAGLLLGLAGCQQSSKSPSSAPAANDPWPKTRDLFIEDYLKAQPYFAAQSGRHEFDGQMPDLSAAGIQHEIDRLHGWRTKLAALDAAAMQPRELFEREYGLSVVDRDLFWLEKARVPFTNPYWYIGQIDPDMYVSREYAPLDQRMKGYIQYARAIPAIAGDIAANLKPPLPKSYIDIGVAIFGGLADFYQHDVTPIFKDVRDQAMQKELVEADAAAAKAMTELKDRLLKGRKSGNEKFALGKDLFAQMLMDTERVDLPIEQIEAAGRADLERNTAALKTECAVYLPKGSLRECVAKEAADKPPGGTGGTLDAARDQLNVLKQFIVTHHVVTIPNDQNARVAEAPPYNRANFAFIQIPGPYEHDVASIYNIAPPDPNWSTAEQAAYVPGIATLMFTSVHEVWPGHFLQFLYSNGNKSKFEGLWVGYGFAEGWAHYSEEMMIEEGFEKGNPEMHIGQLTEALLRDVRLLSAIGLQTRGMTQAASEKMFRDDAFQDPGNARQQAARGTYDPAYLNYTLGKLMIRKLRSDWVAQKLGGKPATADQEHELWHQFHDQFLSYGGPPIPLVRKEMLGGAQGSLL